jgi:cbb3-type cytochrome oxidase maturation protein
MNIIYFLVPMALLLGGGFAAAFINSSKRGQFDDLETPAHRMLLDIEPETKDPVKGNAHE